MLMSEDTLTSIGRLPSKTLRRRVEMAVGRRGTPWNRLLLLLTERDEFNDPVQCRIVD